MAIGNQDRRERRRGQRRAQRLTTRMWLIMGGFVLALVVILGLLIAVTGDGDGGGLYTNVGDHIHAEYSVIVCGEAEPTFPVSSGGVHSHGDGSIHIHPSSPSEAGLNANIARFVASTGSRITDEYIELPSGVQYTNGDLCPDDQPGQMFLRVNGITTQEIASYVPRDGDVIEMGFEVQ
jgi:hypothetical protein